MAMATGTANRRTLFEVELLDPSEGRRCFVCNSTPWPMHTVRPRGGDFGRYACFAHLSEVMVAWDDHRDMMESRDMDEGERR